MTSTAVRSTKRLAEEIDLLSGEMEQLSEGLTGARRDLRADVDRLVLEIEAIKLFLREAHPELVGRFEELREEARHEISPE